MPLVVGILLNHELLLVGHPHILLVIAELRIDTPKRAPVVVLSIGHATVAALQLEGVLVRDVVVKLLIMVLNLQLVVALDEEVVVGELVLV